MIGFVNFDLDRDSDIPSLAEIRALYVAPQAWSQGIGTRLLRAAEDTLSKGNHQAVRLWVLEANTSARHFYEAQGYALNSISRLEKLDPPLRSLAYTKRLN